MMDADAAIANLHKIEKRTQLEAITFLELNPDPRAVPSLIQIA